MRPSPNSCLIVLMLLIGMTGPIGHGKSTFASALMKIEPNTEHLESSLIIAQVANGLHQALQGVPTEGNIDFLNEWLTALPPILLKVVHTPVSYEQIKIKQSDINEHPVEYEKLFLHVKNIIRNPMLAQTVITDENKESYRPFLQWLGGYLVTRVDPTIWYNEIIRRVFEAEAKGRKLCIVGGLRFPTDAQLIKQAGGFVIKVYRPGHLQNDILDPTERERDNIRYDSTVVSNGTVADLEECAKAVYQDALNNSLKRVYESLEFKQRNAAPAEPGSSLPSTTAPEANQAN